MSPEKTLKTTKLAACFPPFALFALGLLAFGAIGALVLFTVQNGGDFALSAIITDPIVFRVVRFTLYQAALSTLLSVLLAIPLSFALFEYKQFIGRAMILRLFALPLVLPQIVAVLAILSLYGNQGLFTQAAQFIGLETAPIYGLTGILIAHVFFNLPLVVRIILGALASMPSEYERLSHQLQMGAFGRLRLVYWPYFKPALFNGAALVFMLCVTSFAVVLILGGGPRATTIEVAIYQALTFDFDIPRAVLLTFLQLGITLFAVFLFARAGGNMHAGMTLASSRPMVTRRSLGQKTIYWALIIIGTLFVLSPFIAIIAKGLAADIPKLLGQTSVWGAIITSLWLGFLSATLCVLASLALCQGAVRSKKHVWLYAHASSLILVVPPIVLAAGWLVLLRPFVNIYSAAPFLIITINAAMALPFAMRFLLPARQASAERHDRLCAQLGINGWARWRLITLPVLFKPLTVAFAFAFALSLGDLGVVALFGSEKVQTLPFLIMQRMGSYRTDDAAGLALILCTMTMALMIFADQSSRGAQQAGDDDE